MGNVLQAGEGQAPARQAAIRGGVPANVGATTVNKVCGSALKAMMQATQAIALGDANLMVVGGMENMSMAPYLVPGARQGLRLGNAALIDAAVHDGLWDSFENVHMGNAAEFIAQQFEITREEQDEFALRSHRRAVAAWNSGKFSAEVVPVTLAGKKGAPLVVSKDEPPRPDTTQRRPDTQRRGPRPGGSPGPGRPGGGGGSGRSGPGRGPAGKPGPRKS